MYYIYQIQFPNGKVRIGQTKDIIKRMKSYKNTAFNTSEKNKQYNSHLNNAIRRYGWENLLIVIITTCGEDKVDEIETGYVSAFAADKRCGGYNIEPGGNKNKHLSEETKKKLSKVKLGKRLSKEHIQKLREASLGKKLSESTKLKLRNCNLGKKYSEETKKKLSKAKLGKNHPMFGKKHSDETKQKIRNTVSIQLLGNKSNLGQKLTKEHKRNLSNAMKLSWKRRKLININ